MAEIVGTPGEERGGFGATERCAACLVEDSQVGAVGQVYATVLIYAETGRRVDVLAGRTAELLETWLREHPGVEVVCRDGSGAYGEAVRRALPGAVQAGDRWHLWHGLAEAVRKEVPCG